MSKASQRRAVRRVFKDFHDSCKRHGTMPMFYTAVLSYLNSELEAGIKKIKPCLDHLEQDCIRMGYQPDNNNKNNDNEIHSKP